MGRNPRFALLAGVGVALLIGVACGRDAFQPLGANGTSPIGSPTSTPVGSPTASPVPSAIGQPFGSGQDGPLVVSNSRQVNVCSSLVSGSGDSVILALENSAAAFASGTRLLIWQVQGSFATTAVQSLVTSAGTQGLAGHWEFARLAQAASAGVAATLQAPLQYTYSTQAGAAAAQACTVPEYTTVVIDAGGTIAAPAWNGTLGGVVAFFASTSVNLSAGGSIAASSDGFRGGVTTSDSGTGEDETANDTTGSQGGGKGESLDIRSFAREGRGNYGNGAGGGNQLQAGGGGGGNGGAGGLGGTEVAGTKVTQTPGMGGAPVTNQLFSLLAFGGGGGAGQQSQSPAAAGGPGGGVVLLFVPTLTGTGSISANGAPGVQPTNNDQGGGGGGAGGTILIVTTGATSSFTGSLSATGGNGTNTVQNTGFHTGPGGGGGGGQVFAPLISNSKAKISVKGGSGGSNGIIGNNGVKGGSNGTADAAE